MGVFSKMTFRKKIAGAALAAVMTLGAAVPAFAHDGWTQTNAPIVAQGQVSYVELLFGNHSNEHKKLPDRRTMGQYFQGVRYDAGRRKIRYYGHALLYRRAGDRKQLQP